jgi:hypothetical protein
MPSCKHLEIPQIAQCALGRPDRISPTANAIRSEQYKVSVNQNRNTLTKPDRIVSCIYRVNLMSLYGAERGKRISFQLGQTTRNFMVISAHAHHEPAITRSDASQSIACVTVFDIFKLVRDRHASVRVIAGSRLFSKGFSYA